jgi:hypothetical protein
MAHKAENVSLNHRLTAIGFRIGFDGPDLKLNHLLLLEEGDLEETLIRGAFEARSDFRLLSVLLTWISVHGNYVIVEKFSKKREAFEKVQGTNRVLDLMAAQAVVCGFHKWKKLIRTSVKHPEIPVDPQLLGPSIQYQGADDDLKKFGILVPKKLLRIRADDVMTPSALARLNAQYRNRLLFGASWRADIVTAIECGVKNANQISRLLGCSYEPAYRVFKDYRAAQGLVG